MQDIYTIIDTSGTTGPPKGTVLTHANALSVADKVRQREIIAEGDTLYLYLPLAHAFALASLLAAYGLGATVVYFGGDTQQILQELIETKPTYVPSVPRIFEKLYGAALKLQAQGSDEDTAGASPGRSNSASTFGSGSRGVRRSRQRCGRRSSRPTSVCTSGSAVCSAVSSNRRSPAPRRSRLRSSSSSTRAAFP